MSTNKNITTSEKQPIDFVTKPRGRGRPKKILDSKVEPNIDIHKTSPEVPHMEQTYNNKPNQNEETSSIQSKESLPLPDTEPHIYNSYKSILPLNSIAKSDDIRGPINYAIASSQKNKNGNHTIQIISKPNYKPRVRSTTKEDQKKPDIPEKKYARTAVIEIPHAVVSMKFGPKNASLANTGPTRDILAVASDNLYLYKLSPEILESPTTSTTPTTPITSTIEQKKIKESIEYDKITLPINLLTQTPIKKFTYKKILTDPKPKIFSQRTQNFTNQIQSTEYKNIIKKLKRIDTQIEGWQEHSLFENSIMPLCLDWNDSIPCIVGVGTMTGACSSWDINKEVIVSSATIFTSPVNNFVFSNPLSKGYGIHYLCSSLEGHIKLVDIRERIQTSNIYSSQERTIPKICWNKNNPFFVAYFELQENKINVVDMRMSDKLWAVLDEHKAPICDIQFSRTEDNKLGSLDVLGNFKAWDLKCEGMESMEGVEGAEVKLDFEAVKSFGCSKEPLMFSWDNRAVNQIHMLFPNEVVSARL